MHAVTNTHKIYIHTYTWLHTSAAQHELPCPDYTFFAIMHTVNNLVASLLLLYS